MATTQTTHGLRRWGSTAAIPSTPGAGEHRTVLDRLSQLEGFVIRAGIASVQAAQHGVVRERGAPTESRQSRIRIAPEGTESGGVEPNH